MILILIAGLAGCSTSTITPPPARPGIPELKATASREISYKLTVNPDADTDGIQFLFLVIPFGHVEIESAEQFIATAFEENLALQGIKATRISNSTQSAKIELQLNSITANAYDLLFIRYLSANVDLGLKLNGTEIPLNASATGYESFGFSQQLTKYIQKAAEKMAKKIIGLLDHTPGSQVTIGRDQ